jgi:hypothetical protein
MLDSRRRVSNRVTSKCGERGFELGWVWKINRRNCSGSDDLVSKDEGSVGGSVRHLRRTKIKRAGW